MITYKPTPLDSFVRIVIAIDPATTYHEKSDETGIVVAGKVLDGTYVVIDDLSGRLSPANWGQRVVDAFHTYKADRVIAEVNKGGDLVERIITSIDGTIPFSPVRATRGKITRAEPIAALYEKQLVFHHRPLRDLEHQLCHYVSGAHASPDRLDAMVWALTELSGITSNFNIWSL
jgi:predicted phage terminase large subunit-like protein